MAKKKQEEKIDDELLKWLDLINKETFELEFAEKKFIFKKYGEFSDLNDLNSKNKDKDLRMRVMFKRNCITPRMNLSQVKKLPQTWIIVFFAKYAEFNNLTQLKMGDSIPGEE